MKQFWDERYAEPHFVYGEAANAFFESKLKELAPGKLLLPCEGEGRQAIYAAAQGWEVDAFDQSEVGREKALQWAAKAGLSFRYTLQDATSYRPKAEYDAVALIFAHLPATHRQQFHRNMAAALQPGGVLLLEGFTPAQLAYTSGGPKDISMLFTVEMLQADFASLEIEWLEEKQVVLNEGPYHQGEAAVIRLIARKAFH